MSRLHIVMYHYVRRETSRFPTLKMRRWADFTAQLDWLQTHYHMVHANDVMDSCYGGKELPDDSCLLTFDDGYQEHFTEVFPELYRRGLSGVFFPPVCATRRDKLMEVNKIHLLLAFNEQRMDSMLAAIKILYDDAHANKVEGFSAGWADMCEHYAKPNNRFDSAEVGLVKSLLQFAIPATWRTKFIDSLYLKFVGIAESVVANEYYMSEDMLRIMASNGMTIGSHGVKHLWLNKITPQEQEREIGESVEMLHNVYSNKNIQWVMGYPFGGVDDSLLQICRNMGCGLGVTTEARPAEIGKDAPMLLPRMDTNDFPIM